MARHALVGRVGPRELGDPGRYAEVLHWLRELGLDPAPFALRLAVVAGDDGQHLLCLSEYALDDAGRKYLDFTTGEAVSRPVTVPVEAGSWPDWLPGLDYLRGGS